MVKTNDLKKGVRVQLSNGWYATIADNLRGNIRMAQVEGFVTETGSVYAHDMVRALVPVGGDATEASDYKWVQIEHTPAQLKLKAAIGAIGL